MREQTNIPAAQNKGHILISRKVKINQYWDNMSTMCAAILHLLVLDTFLYWPNK